MANLLAHALFALALFSVPSSLRQGAPLTEYGFYAALASLAPDLEGARPGNRTPHGHSVAFGFLWALLLVSSCSMAGWLGLLPTTALPVLVGACLTGLTSHLFLDALRDPGIFTWPRGGGQWGRIILLAGHRAPHLGLLVSSVSIGTVLALLVLF